MNSRPPTAAPRYSAAELAAIVGVHPPTPEQAAIIEAEREPTVIIAGAGSGKTETLALRVLWLIANEYADPHRILGLTFTRKAVGELSERIWAFVRTFRRARSRAQGTTAGASSGHGSFADFELPTISTYNSYAASLVSDYGLSIGIESDASVLDAAGSIRLAEQIVVAASPSEIPVGVSRATLIGQVRDMAGQINEHLQSPAAVLEYLDSCIDRLLSEAGMNAHCAAIRRGRKVAKADKDAVIAELWSMAEKAGVGAAGKSHGDEAARDELIERLISVRGDGALARLLNKRRVTVLAERFLAAKRAESAMEFSDQVKYAYEIMSRPDGRVLAIERSRWDAIMLDEYQDTSDSQFQLLQLLFNGKNVMAVGDPRQSIYAWRGASARNISDFPTRFRRKLTAPGGAVGDAPGGTVGDAPGEQYADAHVRTLSIGWRNDISILDVANRISEQLPEYDDKDVLRHRPQAGAGDTRLVTTIGEPDAEFGTDLMAALVSFMRSTTEQWQAEGRTGPPQRAVLCRKRAHLGPTAAALEAAGFDVHIAGSEGLLDDPYVADLHAGLTALVDPSAGAEVMRLLSGRSCALGAADIAALHRFATARNDRAQQVFADATAVSPTPAVNADSASGSDPATGTTAVTGSTPAAASTPAAGAGVPVVGIIEALDDLIACGPALASAGSSSPSQGARAGSSAADADRSAASSPVIADWKSSQLTDTATRRLIRLAESLRYLRRLATTVPGLVRAAIAEFDIDTEIESLPPAVRAAHERAVDAFVSLTADFTSQNPAGDLTAFLTWLTIMDEEQALSMPEQPPGDEAITIMTVHGSKGLGFDIVAIPHLTVGDMPTKDTNSWAWLTGGMLPYPLRGDRHHIPRFDLTDAGLETEEDIEAYRKGPLAEELSRHHETEERRIAYVAVTRAKKHLWLGGSLYTTRKKPNEFSPYLHEAAEVLGYDTDDLFGFDPETAERPEFTSPAVMWPRAADATQAAERAQLRAIFASALRARPQLEDIAAAEAVGTLAADDPGAAVAADVAALARMALQLQAESGGTGDGDTVLPTRLSATGLVQLAEDPAEFRRELHRPMPQGPSHAAGLGTAFHAWVENYYGQAALSDLDDDPNTSTLPAYLHDRLDALCRRFEGSRFAGLEPAAIEQSFELVLTTADGSSVTVPGKIDAIFPIDGGFYVVDWKTGRSPQTEAELETRSIQLAVYRLAVQKMPAFASAQRIECGFYFLGDDVEVTVPHVMDEAELVERLAL